jgi:hypothetical protein
LREEPLAKTGRGHGLCGVAGAKDAAVWHGFTAGETISLGVELFSAIAVLFGGVVEEATAAFKVGRVIRRAARLAVEAKEGLGHFELRDGAASYRAIGQGLAVIKQRARQRRNVVCGEAVAIEAAIQCAEHTLSIHR